MTHRLNCDYYKDPNKYIADSRWKCECDKCFTRPDYINIENNLLFHICTDECMYKGTFYQKCICLTDYEHCKAPSDKHCCSCSTTGIEKCKSLKIHCCICFNSNECITDDEHECICYKILLPLDRRFYFDCKANNHMCLCHMYCYDGDCPAKKHNCSCHKEPSKCLSFNHNCICIDTKNLLCISKKCIYKTTKELFFSHGCTCLSKTEICFAKPTQHMCSCSYSREDITNCKSHKRSCLSFRKFI